MSRSFTVMVLGVLIVLLGVMSWVVRKSTEKPEPPKPDPKQAEMARHAQMQTMKKEMEARQKMIRAAAKGSGNKAKPDKHQPQAHAGNAMDISDKWFTKTQEGQAGYDQMQKVREQQEKAEQVMSRKGPVTPPANIPVQATPSR